MEHNNLLIAIVLKISIQFAVVHTSFAPGGKSVGWTVSMTDGRVDGWEVKLMPTSGEFSWS